MPLDPIDETTAKSPLMLIDDNVHNLELLESILRWGGFENLRTFKKAQDGLDALSQIDPHLIVLDLKMPGMSGFDFLKAVRETRSATSFLPILVFTADLTSESRIKALELGASDFLTKPGDAIEIQLRIRNFLEIRKLQGELQNQNEQLESRVRERTELLAASRRDAVELLASASEYRDDETGKHTHRVGDMSAKLAEIMGLDREFVECIRLVAPLHDIGKISIPDSILHKPGPLTDEEYDLMKTHVVVGADLLAQKSSPFLLLATEIARYHHERWDGRGYSAGLSGEAIPLSARIVSVADSFDAMTNDRPYRKGRSSAEALLELKKFSGTQFDPRIVSAMERVLLDEGEDRLAA